MNQFYTAESVTEGHPDKLCDIIADSVLDECLAHDALSRVACEVLATKGQVIVAGEITSLFEPDIPSIVHSVFRKAGYDPARFSVQCLLHRQSPDIAAGVDCSLERRRNPSEDQPALQLGGRGSGRHGGVRLFGNPAEDASAGGAGPPSHQRPRRRPENRDGAGPAPGRESAGHRGIRRGWQAPCGWIPLCCLPSTARISPWTNSAGNSPIRCWPRRCRLYPPDEDTKILLNPSGRFVLGGPEADTGLTGRKLMVDSYGVFAPARRRCVFRQRSHQGGPFRGIHGPVHRQKPCGGGLVRKVPSHAGLCHRESRAGHGGGGYLRHRYGLCRRLSGRGGALRVRLNACGDHRPA